MGCRLKAYGLYKGARRTVATNVIHTLSGIVIAMIKTAERFSDEVDRGC